ncbi:hypothetical protein KC980_00380 [candidate division WWE3 bacterium]|uniref:Uncharacterized protein n=1 Tax=candidate division WWE3 bacterium TaxID=2053526 RepID=A0A955ECB5_UNCKA|nr:hypothetical protein [candidate division WWE3 bacterium]
MDNNNNQYIQISADDFKRLNNYLSNVIGNATKLQQILSTLEMPPAKTKIKKESPKTLTVNNGDIGSVTETPLVEKVEETVVTQSEEAAGEQKIYPDDITSSSNSADSSDLGSMSIEADGVVVEDLEDVAARQLEQGSSKLGFFDGNHLVTEDNKKFVVPANYSAKSKLIYGDILEMIATPDGDKNNFKIIKKIPRETVTGMLSKDNTDWKLLTAKGVYKLSPTAASFMEAQPKMHASALIPKENPAAPFAALDSVGVPMTAELTEVSSNISTSSDSLNFESADTVLVPVEPTLSSLPKESYSPDLPESNAFVIEEPMSDPLPNQSSLQLEQTSHIDDLNASLDKSFADLAVTLGKSNNMNSGTIYLSSSAIPSIEEPEKREVAPSVAEVPTEMVPQPAYMPPTPPLRQDNIAIPPTAQTVLDEPFTKVSPTKVIYPEASTVQSLDANKNFEEYDLS